MKKLLALLLAMCMFVSLLAGCGDDSSSSADNSAGNSTTNTADSGENTSGSSTAASKTTLNVISDMLSSTLEPATNWNSWFVVRVGLGETLIRFGEDGSFEPWLAESWSVAEDNLTWTIKLKDNVVFSNGTPMTASKVVASIERLYEKEDPANGGTGNPQNYMTYSSITADDQAGTVTIVTENPTPDMPGCLAYPWMLIMDVEGSEGRDIDNLGPVCTGPYIVESYTQDSDIQLVKNENYWDGEVPFERINWMIVSESATRLMALQDGSADLVIRLAASDRDILEAEGGYNIGIVAGSRLGYAHINFNGILGNDTIRKAILMAIDDETICDVTTKQTYSPGFAPVAPNLGYGYEKLSDPYAYDPDGAMAMLDEAGIVDTNGDGYRELDGQTVEFEYKMTANRSMDLIIQAQATQIEAIGIKCNIVQVDSNNDILNNRTFDICSSNEVTCPTGDPAKFLTHWYSKSNDNYSSYSNAEYDRIFELLSVEFDEDARRDYITQLQQILIDDAAMLPYGYYNSDVCSSNTITGVICSSSDYYWITKDIKPAA